MKTAMLVVGLMTCGGASIASAKPKNLCASIENSSAEFDLVTKEFKGCRLITVTTGSVYASLGLKPGDVVQPGGTAGGAGHKMEIISSGKQTTKRESAEQ